MWRIYGRTRKDADNAHYKEALNAATTEIRQSKRSYDQKLACNINMTARGFMRISGINKTYKTKVGNLEDSAGNIISKGFLMAKDLNE